MMTEQRLTEIRESVTAATPNGPWEASWDSCDEEYCSCPDGGRFIHAIYGPTSVSYSSYPEESLLSVYRKTVSEVCDFTNEAAQFVAEAPHIVTELLDEVERQRTRAKFFERAAAKATREINLMADAHEQCDAS
ncbi:hypothetical protein AHiyo6_02940 [Arthrobacter sp. Hiyo6]|nr:hypothetical protein AHiyo6_02940 [Arthrobacter sp. Hiyo6]